MGCGCAKPGTEAWRWPDPVDDEDELPAAADTPEFFGDWCGTQRRVKRSKKGAVHANNIAEAERAIATAPGMYGRIWYGQGPAFDEAYMILQDHCTIAARCPLSVYGVH